MNNIIMCISHNDIHRNVSNMVQDFYNLDIEN